MDVDRGLGELESHRDPGRPDRLRDSLSLPAGRYLISVLADGFKLDGAHLTVPDGGTVAVTVELQPTPLPDATVRALVFHDNARVNSPPDLPAEQGLAGFEGQLTDSLGQIITDV